MKRFKSRKGYVAFIVVITLSIVFIGCGGGSGGGGDSNDTQREITLSGSQFVPGQFLTVSHPSISGGSDSIVQFEGADGYAVTIQSSLTEDGSVLVVVPPYVNPQTGEFITGEVSVSVRGIDSEESIIVDELPEIESVNAGSALKALLEEEIAIYQGIRSQLEISAEYLDHTDVLPVTDGIDTHITTLNQMIAEMETKGTLTLSMSDGSDIILGSDELLTADRLIRALLEGIMEEYSISAATTSSLIHIQAEGDDTSIYQWVKNAVQGVKAETKKGYQANQLILGGVSLGLTVIGITASWPVATVAGTAGLMITVYSSMTSVAVGTVSEAAAESLNINERQQYNTSKEALNEVVAVTKQVSENLPGPLGNVVTITNNVETFVSMTEILSKIRDEKCEVYEPKAQQHTYTRSTVLFFCTGAEGPEDSECTYISDSEAIYKKPTRAACELNDGVWTDVHNLILDLCSYECSANWYDANKICTLPTIEQWEEVDPSDCSQYYIDNAWSSSTDASNDTKAWVSNCGSAGHFSFTEGKFYEDKAVRCIQGEQ